MKCYCGSYMVLRKSKYGSFYGCKRYPECHGTAALHPNGTVKSYPADKKTAKARIKAHEWFDKLWKVHSMTRKQAYKWLSKKMGLSKEEAHIGFMDASMCGVLISLVREEIKVKYER